MDYKNVNDYEVLYLVKENDEDAQGFLINKYLPVIKKISYKYYNFAKGCGIEFDDLIQEGMIALLKCIKMYNEDCNVLFYTYANLCIERHIITYCRNISGKKHSSLNNSVSDECLFGLADYNYSVDNYLDYNISVNNFIYIKSKLELPHSSVFELRYNGFTYKEISKLLDIPLSTVDSRLCKIRKIICEIQ